MRVDAQRNRTRVLEAALAAFATEGLSVPVAEIARRAGVGTGTVSRHFPTKESLYEAIVLDRVEFLVTRANELADAHDPGTAFLMFLDCLIEQGAVDRGLAQALAGAGFDIEAAASGAAHDLPAVERKLLARAQEAGAVRADVTQADIKALVVGCLVREQHGADPAARRRLFSVICQGLRA